jgi:NarL family two-component system response regulator LiaR
VSDAQRIGVLIVDDHAMVRQGLGVFLSMYPDIEVLGEAASGEDAIRRCEELAPDVVLMDMEMPGMDGATTTARVKEITAECQVIILTSFVDPDKVQRALEAGAISYLLKDASPDKVAEAIQQAHRGRGTIDASAAQALVTRSRKAEQTVGTDLTQREREVLALLVAGLSNGDIAARLYLSIGTVRLHVSNILAKLEVPNRTAAAMLAVEHHLVEAPR